MLFAIIACVLVGFAYQNCSQFEALISEQQDLLSQAGAPRVATLKSPQVSSDDVIYPWPYEKTMVGTSHAAPLYDPAGLLAEEVLYHGSLDSLIMGFNVTKIWLGPEVGGPFFYRLSRPFTTPADLMMDPQYQKTLRLPFPVTILEVDSAFLWSITNGQKFTAEQVATIERETYELTKKLLKDYAGSGKVFIIQNHEGDNHLANFTDASKYKMLDPNYVPPAENSYENYRLYFKTRQAAVRRARKEVGATNVAVYHMCEVNAVVRVSQPDLLKDRTRDAEAVGQSLVKTSLTTEVLPHLDCDLYGYSAYDSIFFEDSTVVGKSLAFIRAHTQPSAAFGRNNVVISEAGIPEQEAGFKPQVPGFTQRAKTWIQNLGIPMVVFWNLYDNECASGDCKQSLNGAYKNAEQSQMRGFWMRDMHGNYGNFFKGLKALIEIQTSDDEAAQSAYELLYGRKMNTAEHQAALNEIRARGREQFYLGLAGSVEARGKMVTDVFQKILKKAPTDEQKNHWSQIIQKYPLAVAANFLVSQGTDLAHIDKSPNYPVELDPNLTTEQKALKKLLLALYKGLLSREPSDAELAKNMSTGGKCQAIAKNFAISDAFLNASASLKDEEFVQKLYQGLLLRAGESAGVSGWVSVLQNRKSTRAEVGAAFALSDEMKGLCERVYQLP